MDKLKDLIKENSFEGAMGGYNGALNYQTALNTPNYRDQYPSKFQSSNQNKAINQMGNTAKDTPDPMQMGKDIDKIYKQKKVPTADQVKAGLDYELHNMIKPDRQKAKELVLKNLRQDADYYGKLHFMNIDDKHMKVDVAEVKKIAEEMSDKYGPKREVNPVIANVMKEMFEQRKASKEFISNMRKRSS
jgi:hypothetical protein